jgi:hypothetical protein
MREWAFKALNQLVALPDDRLVEEFWFLHGDGVDLQLFTDEPGEGDFYDASWSRRANNLVFLLDTLSAYSLARMHYSHQRKLGLRVLDTDSFRRRVDESEDALTVEEATGLLESFPVISSDTLWEWTMQ